MLACCQHLAVFSRRKLIPSLLLWKWYLNWFLMAQLSWSTWIPSRSLLLWKWYLNWFLMAQLSWSTWIPSRRYKPGRQLKKNIPIIAKTQKLILQLIEHGNLGSHAIIRCNIKTTQFRESLNFCNPFSLLLLAALNTNSRKLCKINALRAMKFTSILH